MLVLPVLTYDPLDPATVDNPYPALAALREQAPVSWHEGMSSWLVTRYADCTAVLREHTVFARDRRRTGATVPEASLSVQSLDPPDQAGVRSLFMNALRAQELPALEARARDRAAALLREAAERPSFDVMAELAAPLSLSVVCDLLGVDEPPLAEFAAASDAIMRSMDGGLDPTRIEPGRRAREELTSLVDSWFTETGRPGGLLAHVRAHTPTRANPAEERFIRNTARVMFQGGYSTMTAALGNALHTLTRHPDAQHRLRSEPRGVPWAAEELVRFDGPVQGTSRTATHATTIAGVPIPAGDTVVLLFAAANRDPARFPTPDQLLLDRRDNRHLGYGWGTHSCIGTRAAQACLRAALDALRTRSTPLRPAGTARRQPSATMRTFAVLPATLHP
ncbi:cytochrome P450 [Streptomyces sp. NPDC008121]|uniref:cytochrome P450 n=1 Tax=Streptomyces sp. NPDC008121 TaxID=3364809 RepID=UPI0036E1BFDC